MSYAPLQRMSVTRAPLSLVSALVVVSAGLAVGLGEQGDQSSPRTDRNSQIAHAQLLEKARYGGIDIYFEGDSITRRRGTTDP